MIDAGEVRRRVRGEQSACEAVREVRSFLEHARRSLGFLGRLAGIRRGLDYAIRVLAVAEATLCPARFPAWPEPPDVPRPD